MEFCAKTLVASNARGGWRRMPAEDELDLKDHEQSDRKRPGELAITPFEGMGIWTNIEKESWRRSNENVG